MRNKESFLSVDYKSPRLDRVNHDFYWELAESVIPFERELANRSSSLREEQNKSDALQIGENICETALRDIRLFEEEMPDQNDEDAKHEFQQIMGVSLLLARRSASLRRFIFPVMEIEFTGEGGEVHDASLNAINLVIPDSGSEKGRSIEMNPEDIAFHLNKITGIKYTNREALYGLILGFGLKQITESDSESVWRKGREIHKLDQMLNQTKDREVCNHLLDVKDTISAQLVREWVNRKKRISEDETFDQDFGGVDLQIGLIRVAEYGSDKRLLIKISNGSQMITTQILAPQNRTIKNDENGRKQSGELSKKLHGVKFDFFRKV